MYMVIFRLETERVKDQQFQSQVAHVLQYRELGEVLIIHAGWLFGVLIPRHHLLQRLA